MKTALITGGSRGIGAACVKAFSQAGYAVCFFYRRDEENAKKVADATGAKAVRCDVSDPEAVRRGVKEARAQLMHIDVLVNNAGIAKQQLFTDVTDQDWQEMVGVNLSGCFYTTREVLPEMVSRKSGSIVNISSMWGQEGASCEAAYSAVKAGVIGLTKALAKETGMSGVRVNCVAPGVIATDMLSGFSEEDLQALAEETPLCRLGTPQEVAKAVLFLAGDEASFITGQTLGVNGGFI